MPELSEGPAIEVVAPIRIKISYINPDPQDVAQAPALIPTAIIKSNPEDVAEYSATNNEAEESPCPEPTEETRQEARNFTASQMAEDVEQMRKMCEFPEMMSLLQTAKSWLQMTDFSVYEVERMFSFPQCSAMLNTVMTALLCTECERRRLDEIPSMPYELWMPRLKRKVSRWFSWYDLRPDGQNSVFDIDPRFWKMVGENNPLQMKNLTEIPFKQRVWIAKALCDSMLNKHPVLRDMCAKMAADDLRDMRDLGKDAAGNRLFHLRTLAEDDLRVYRVGPGTDDLEPEAQPTAQKKTREDVLTPVPIPLPLKRPRGRPRKKKKEAEETTPAAEVDTPNTSLCTSPNSSYIAETGDFEMVVDSLQSLKELIAAYQIATEESSRPLCEVQLLTKLEDLLSDFQEFEAQLADRLQHSQCEIYTRWQQFQERADDFVDPDAELWEKPLKLSRSSTPVPFAEPADEVLAHLELAPVKMPNEEEVTNTPTSNVSTFTPEVTRSGRKITSRISSLLEYGELSEDSDVNDVWTVPGKKKVLKPRLPKIQEETTNGAEVKIPKKRGRKRKADKIAAEKNVPIVDIANATAEKNSAVTNAEHVAKNADSLTTTAPASDDGVILLNSALASNSGDILPNSALALNYGDILPFSALASNSGDILPNSAPISNTTAGTNAVPVPNAVLGTLISSNLGSCVVVGAATNGIPSVDIASLLRSSPAIPGRPGTGPILIVAKQNGNIAAANLVGQRTPSSSPAVRSSLTPLRTPPGVQGTPSVGYATPKPKRTPVRRRLTVSPATTICRGATSITAAPSTPKISSQVTVTMVQKKSEVIVIDSDDDDVPAIRLPSACSLVRVKKPVAPRAPPIPRLPPSISVTAVTNMRTGRSVPYADIIISDDEDEVVNPVYRVVLSEKGQNLAQVLPDGRLRVLSDAEVALIRSRNNGRLM